MITLYTTHCPKCNILTMKLNAKNIPYVENTDIELMQSKGIKTVPYLEVDNILYDFTESVKLINTMEESK